MMATPFYSEKDETLIKQTAVRDYLGVLPVWSKVARNLEPHLAGAIGSYHGISAVLFIYHLAPSLGQAKQFRIFFKYMELLTEYYLCHEINTGPCYGSRILNIGNKKQLLLNPQSATIANGLYQFYRGSCRRAGMLSADWDLDPAVSTILDNISQTKPYAVKALVNIIEQHIEDNTAVIKPYEIFQDEAINSLFKALFSSSALVTYFKSKLFGDQALAFYAMTCHTTIKENETAGPLILARAINDKLKGQNPNWPYALALENILDCEPFLSALDQCFQLLHYRDGKSFDNIASFFEDSVTANALKTKARLFLHLADVTQYQQGRFKSLFELATIINNCQFSEFLQALAQYHERVMKGRGGESMLLIEDDTVRSIVDIAPNTPDQIKAKLRAANTANNGYYLKTTARIYRQLFEPNTVWPNLSLNSEY